MPAAKKSDSTGERLRPELMVRTYVATTGSSDQFDPMVAAEAQRRNFSAAARRAFLGDGSAWIWKLQHLYFPDFVPIVDFLHALVHIFAAAKAAAPDAGGRSELFEAWAEACWKGRVEQVIEELRILRDVQLGFCGGDLESLAEDDPRRVVARVLGYLEANQDRMDYPHYRREGLPWTTSHVESTVKQFNRRVKGTEKFRGEAGAEAMLQLRAAFLSEDGRLDRHLKEAPCSPFLNYKTNEAPHRVTREGIRMALLCTRTYNRILRPGLAQIIPLKAQDDSDFCVELLTSSTRRSTAGSRERKSRRETWLKHDEFGKPSGLGKRAKRRRISESQTAFYTHRRYLDALAVVNDPAPAYPQLRQLTEPMVVAGRSYACFNPSRRDDLRLFRAILDGDHIARGFRNADIREPLFGKHLKPAQQRRASAAVGRLLKRLHVRHLVAKIPRTRRWRVTEHGRQLLERMVQLYYPVWAERAA